MCVAIVICSQLLQVFPRGSAAVLAEGGFFYGHQFQDEAAAQYAEQDLEFCDWAKEALSNGKTVVYSCWW